MDTNGLHPPLVGVLTYYPGPPAHLVPTSFSGQPIKLPMPLGKSRRSIDVSAMVSLAKSPALPCAPLASQTTQVPAAVAETLSAAI